MAQGSSLLLFVSATGVTTTGLLEVPMQGDLRVNPGKTVQTTTYKNGQSAFMANAGFTVTLNMGNTAPLSPAETRMWDLTDTGELAYFEVQNAVTGGLEWSFIGRAAVSDFSAPTSGDTTTTLTVAADGQPTRSVAA